MQLGVAAAAENARGAGVVEADGAAFGAVVQAFDAQTADLAVKRAGDVVEDKSPYLTGALGVADGAVAGFADDDRKRAADNQIAVTAVGGRDGLDAGAGGHGLPPLDR